LDFFMAACPPFAKPLIVNLSTEFGETAASASPDAPPVQNPNKVMAEVIN
jgi:hypothetical protein